MLKIGVFGAGNSAKSHIEQWRDIPGVALVGLYDPENSETEPAAEQYGLRTYRDADELIALLDAADIVSPVGTHFEIAKKCLLAQKHIFIEKPVALSLHEASELVNLVHEANVKCQVGYAERYNPALLALAGHSLQPMFIEVHRLAQFSPQDMDVSVVTDHMINDIDIVLHIVRSPVKRISASGVAVINETADIANARIEFDNGCVANLTSSRISLMDMQRMRLFQRDAYIGIDLLDKKTEIVSLKDAAESPAGRQLQMANGDRKVISVDTPGIAATDPLRMQLQEFAEAVLGDKPVRVSIYDAFQAMDVADQVLKKMSLHNEMHNV